MRGPFGDLGARGSDGTSAAGEHFHSAKETTSWRINNSKASGRCFLVHRDNCTLDIGEMIRLNSAAAATAYQTGSVIPKAHNPLQVAEIR